ncbi:MAG: alpha/beta fold hydrolase [Gemmatimonadales bacterium]|nr:MAG: alpha/beta fold hydrolase [Gemmatimonadales bacterium]
MVPDPHWRLHTRPPETGRRIPIPRRSRRRRGSCSRSSDVQDTEPRATPIPSPPGLPSGRSSHESAVTFGRGRTLVGIVTLAEQSAVDPRTPWAIFLNAGLVHRVGPNRLHVRAARILARRGIPALRFDLSGVGDSLPAPDARPTAERWVHETRTAMDFLEERHGAECFLLIGHCSGALGAYLAARADPRVSALALVNPAPPRVPLRYRIRLGLSHPNFWRRLMGSGKLPPTGPVAPGREGAASRGGSRGEVLEGLLALVGSGRRVLVVHSEWDPGYDYFHRTIRPRLPEGTEGERLRFRVVNGSNHDFSLTSVQAELLAIIEGWAADLPGARRIRAGHAGRVADGKDPC